MTTDHDVRRLAAVIAHLRAELHTATTAGDQALAERLRGELALLEDLALPEAVSELRLQHLALTATATAVARPVPADLVRFLG